MPLSGETSTICQFPVGVTASGQIMADAQMSIRCQISPHDEVCESLSIQVRLRNFGVFQFHRRVTLSEMNTLADLVDSNGPSSV